MCTYFCFFLHCCRASSNENNETTSNDSSLSPEPPDRPPGKPRQIHPEGKSQVLAYDSTFRKRDKPKNIPIEEHLLYNHLANSNVAMSPVYPLTPNICMEGGKIEFIKSPLESARNSVALSSPPQTPMLVCRRNLKEQDAQCEDVEKFDDNKVGGAVF